MSEPNKSPCAEAFERYDEAQSFLQLLADMLNRLIGEQTEQEAEPAETAEESAGS
jgi:hypothetical protein